jgi:quercetin dioxygenase-like cupin family protein
MSAIDVWSLESREIMPGFHARIVHTEHTTHLYWDIEEGASVPAHNHHHEQVVNVLEGTFELVVDGTPHELNAGDVFVVQSHAMHSGTAKTACKILDVFTPVREDCR